MIRKKDLKCSICVLEVLINGRLSQISICHNGSNERMKKNGVSCLKYVYKNLSLHFINHYPIYICMLSSENFSTNV